MTGVQMVNPGWSLVAPVPKGFASSPGYGAAWRWFPVGFRSRVHTCCEPSATLGAGKQQEQLLSRSLGAGGEQESGQLRVT